MNSPSLSLEWMLFMSGMIINGATRLSTGAMNLIPTMLDTKKKNASLLMLGGYHSLGPGGYAAASLGEILPVVLGSRQIGQITEPFLPELTPEGVRHPILAGIGGFFPSSSQAEPATAGLPPLEGCTRVEAARPGATILAVCPLQTPATSVGGVAALRNARRVVDHRRRLSPGAGREGTRTCGGPGRPDLTPVHRGTCGGCAEGRGRRGAT